ncbi:RNA 2',3'-cyclic phosphodiesterase [Zeimonas arvi]|nr:RNA 2',3'-cyclic phosphodiesterase [Zeimonas arvi]
MAEPSCSPLAASRFFVALRPDVLASGRLGRLAAELGTRCRGRPLAARDLHLTLAFIGELPLAEGDRLVALLAGLPAKHPGFALDEIGRFGPALLWAGPSEDPPWIAPLVDAVRERLRAGGVRFDARAFKSHLTLVRNARDRAAVGTAIAHLDPKRAHPVSTWRLAVGGSHPEPTPERRYLWRRLPDIEAAGTERRHRSVK